MFNYLLVITVQRDFNLPTRKLPKLATLRRVRNTFEESELQRMRNCSAAATYL